MSTEADIVERLRKHVNDRGGASIDNGAWQMMLDAANEIELARAMCDEALQSGHKWRAAARDMRERMLSKLEELYISDPKIHPMQIRHALMNVPTSTVIATDRETPNG